MFAPTVNTDAEQESLLHFEHTLHNLCFCFSLLRNSIFFCSSNLLRRFIDLALKFKYQTGRVKVDSRLPSVVGSIAAGAV
jgi:hypothetical protein